MSIERYVLATYFENMLVYANVIMKQLSQGRYQLLRKDDAGKGRSQQGLELDVLIKKVEILEVLRHFLVGNPLKRLYLLL